MSTRITRLSVITHCLNTVLFRLKVDVNNDAVIISVINRLKQDNNVHTSNNSFSCTEYIYSKECVRTLSATSELTERVNN